MNTLLSINQYFSCITIFAQRSRDTIRWAKSVFTPIRKSAPTSLYSNTSLLKILVNSPCVLTRCTIITAELLKGLEPNTNANSDTPYAKGNSVETPYKKGNKVIALKLHQ